MFCRTGMSQQLSTKAQSIKMKCYKTKQAERKQSRMYRKGPGVNEGPRRERKREGGYI